MVRAIQFGMSSAVFGGLLALAWGFYPALFPWVVGLMIAGIVFSKADLE